MVNPPVIQLQNVTKSYGKTVGVQDLNLMIEEGVVFGFLGPNGAGKSTTINMLLDFIRPTKGSIKLFGKDLAQSSVDLRQRIGFLAGDMAMDRGLSGWQQLEYFGKLKGSFDKKYIQSLAERLECDLTRKFRTLSRGNKQKVGLITALMHRPDLLILDEPTSGLDPLVQQEFNKIITEHKSSGKSVFISSHILSEVQDICDEVAFIRAGRIVATKPVVSIAKDLPKNFTIVSPDKTFLSQLKKVSGLAIVSRKGSVTKGTFTGDVNRLLSLLAAHRLESFTLTEADLETVFMGYYGDDHAR